MNYWLIKSEPNTYSWDDLVKLGKDHWDGVRNYQARNNMKAMKPGDLALFYHSVKEKSVVGIAECASEFYQDPTTDDDRWVVVDFVPKEKLKKPVTLDDIKAVPELSEMVLVKNSRLSVQPVKKEEFDKIIAMSEA
ncbi:putative RNA-binding protein with PUA-like domain [Roseivirga pacifica]|uniref:Predicted RNA-binding protein, contains PUA-like domain n=1 Tax=Roseivirga pacifica TaxID=1267423 RepID=A0A1I0MBE0_9BACT|nr:EVE domain-containing protein [Roseivirga pacifica]MCO6358728.1 EVE domain-containing protein [Roseivirga pacifica]MCO6365636.1 EVE domain-containing protein [Roseivirga pacifica]MCO6371634.1 EVE domain-containing protein [Roseivirga pacifica]MCO6376255.1 EVE domain-containing protein [Roseivirga pacifica]MCO6379012.1 EVE domain-containing protein [Roseivirga pacifica]|tara:strand:- start:590 stop:997 length:408 start_codon:yes stop_codon:yes gene_type:complete